jgi:UDP-N-acetylmuramyl pentapeptide phosphotransferase/UDP-N-acetylglucosamine-1-phosphate transferase
MVSGHAADLPALFSFVIADSAAGFLPHNFPRARMFMEDVGSAPLGFVLASLVLWLAKMHGWWLLIPLALIHGILCLIPLITLWRRLARGERWYAAHREHFYQRFAGAGKSPYLGYTFGNGLAGNCDVAYRRLSACRTCGQAGFDNTRAGHLDCVLLLL